MKVAFVSSYKLDDNMAAAARLRRMVEYAATSGWQTDVITPGDSAPSGDSGLFGKALALPAHFGRVGGLAWRALRAECDVYFVSSPPLSMMFVAAALAFFSGKRVVFEERDLLTINPLTTFGLVRKNRLMQAFEGWLLRRLDAVVVVTPGLKDDMEARWPALTRRERPIEVVFSGFWKKDYEFLATLAAPRPSGPLHLIHTGNFYGSRNPIPLARALGALKTQDPSLDIAVLLRVKLVGRFGNESERQALLDEVAKAGLESVFELSDLKPRREALTETYLSDIALLVTHTSGSENAIPAKMFEYIALARPILAITHDPMVVEAIESNRLGWCVRHDDTAGLAKVLGDLLRAPESVRGREMPGLRLAAYDSEKGLERLVGLFKSLKASS